MFGHFLKLITANVTSGDFSFGYYDFVLINFYYTRFMWDCNFSGRACVVFEKTKMSCIIFSCLLLPLGHFPMFEIGVIDSGWSC